MRYIDELVAISGEMKGFERLKNDYESCPDFGKIYIMLRDRLTREMDEFLLHDIYLFKFCKLCIPVRPSGISSLGNCMLEVRLATSTRTK